MIATVMTLPVWTVISDRLVQAATTWPDVHAWGLGLVLFIGYGSIALPLGFWSGLLILEWVPSWITILTTVAVTFFFPSLVEELLFRVLLLPHPTEHQPVGAIALWGLGSLLLFVLAHPLNAWLVMKSRRATFWDPWFLVLAALLGGACTLTYLHSGSLWTPVLLHWIVVIVWLLGFGGDRRMSPPCPSTAFDRMHS